MLSSQFCRSKGARDERGLQLRPAQKTEVQTLSRRFLWLMGLVLVPGSAVVARVFLDLDSARRQFAVEAQLARESADQIRASTVVYSGVGIRRGATFSEVLDGMGVEPAAAEGIIRSVREVFDPRQMRAGAQLEIGRTVEGQLREVRYKIDADRMLSVRSSDAGFEATVRPIPWNLATVMVRGEIRDSLFAAVDDAGEGPELALRLAEIFGWDLDFNSDPRAGDTFRVQVEKKTSLDGKTRSYGEVFFAEYINDGHPYQALLFHDTEGRPAYYSPDGRSLQKAFLRSPLKFSAAVTSGFSRGRLHPILQQRRAHLGVDYRAPVGAPVQAIGPGRVVFAGYKGGNGNMVHLRHANGYETQYLHLSRILVRTGQRVESGERIGLVGQTGLATGPHLHFNFLQQGVHRNFEVVRRNLPPTEPVAREYMAEFAAVRERVMTQMDGAGLLAQGADDPEISPSIPPAAIR
jgi:murein DD-endopeptidase MepM/ murein hydrolase activator NlpD